MLPPAFAPSLSPVTTIHPKGSCADGPPFFFYFLFFAPSRTPQPWRTPFRCGPSEPPFPCCAGGLPLPPWPSQLSGPIGSGGVDPGPGCPPRDFDVVPPMARAVHIKGSTDTETAPAADLLHNQRHIRTSRSHYLEAQVHIPYIWWGVRA